MKQFLTSILVIYVICSAHNIFAALLHLILSWERVSQNTMFSVLTNKTTLTHNTFY